MYQRVCVRCGRKMEYFDAFMMNFYDCRNRDNNGSYNLCRECFGRYREFMDGKVCTERRIRDEIKYL